VRLGEIQILKKNISCFNEPFKQNTHKMADESGLPAAPLASLLKDLLPAGVKASPEARDILLACCNGAVV
jgi:hypothetical protein